MNATRFRTPGGQHKYLPTAPYSQHQLPHLQPSRFYCWDGSLHRSTSTRVSWCSLSLTQRACSSSAAVPQQVRGQPPASLLPLSRAIPRRCRVGSPSPRDGEQLRSRSARRAPPVLQLQPILATKDEELTFCGICCYSRLCCIFCLHLLSPK